MATATKATGCGLDQALFRPKIYGSLPHSQPVDLSIVGVEAWVDRCGPATCIHPEVGSYLRLIDFVYHSTPGLSVIKKKKKCIHSPTHLS